MTRTCLLAHPCLSALVALVVAAVVVSEAEGARDVYSYPDYADKQSRQRRLSSGHRPMRHRRGRSERPNIVVIMTDDQDVLLGSMKAMPKMQALLRKEGVYFNNSFVSTPMCCPSRSTFLTGLYVHNHNVYTNNDNCSSSQWVEQHEPHTFATYLQKGGYRTGYFGKYLNKYNGTHVPLGWDHWVGLVRNSRFYNYTLNYRGSLIKHYDNYYSDYLTDLIANDSVAFFKRSKRAYPTEPVMMVLSVPAPHGPEDAAPQYQHMFVNNTDHRTASWNLAPNEDKQWLLRQMSPMTPQYKIFTDLLQRRRLQTLQSVDDLVEKVHEELSMLGELDNTYILFTSDHGYHLGQFGLIKGKSLAYDFDTRVPLVVRGPGIRPGAVVHNIAANVDLAPTLLDMGQVDIPSHMDGTSLLPLLKATSNPSRMHSFGFVTPWRDSILLERGKVSKKMIKDRMRKEKLHLMQMSNQRNLHLYLQPKQQKVMRECSKPDNQLPCKPQQKWYCQVDLTGRQRLHKCRDRGRLYNSQTNSLQADEPQPCQCSDGQPGFRNFLLKGPRRHRRTLKQHTKRKAKNRLLRQRRSAIRNFQDFAGAFPLGHGAGISLRTRRCRILANNTVSCDQDIYRDYEEWQSHRERIDEMIKEYKKALEDLQDIRQHLLEERPQIFQDNSDQENVGHENSVMVTDDCDCDGNLSFPTDREDRWQQRQLRRQKKLQRRQQRMEERSKRRGRRGRKKKNCNGRNMKCFSHDNDHWKTPPYWSDGPFCFCSNANNNTYWCLRTVNQTHDFLYCEYITNFIAYYNMKTDPDQLHNVAKDLNYGVLQQLHDQLATLKVCSGRPDCDLHTHRGRRTKHSSWLTLPTFEDNSDDYGSYINEGIGDDFDDTGNGMFMYGGEGESDLEEEEEEADPDFF